MDQDRSGGISPTGVILIVLGSVGVGVLVCAGVIVVCLVAITALGTSANATFGTVGTKIPDRPDLPVRQAATQFINDLCDGLTQSAWDQTTSDFQSRHIKVGVPDQSKYFTDTLQEYPGLRKPAAIDIISHIIVSDKATIEASVTPRSGERINLNLKLQKQLGTWKISDLEILDAEAAKRKLQETGKEINKRRRQNEDAKDRK